MCKNTLSALEFDASTAKRAQYEAFDFEPVAPGLVTVRNESHENADEHSYHVNVEGGVPVALSVQRIPITREHANTAWPLRFASLF